MFFQCPFLSTQGYLMGPPYHDGSCILLCS